MRAVLSYLYRLGHSKSASMPGRILRMLARPVTRSFLRVYQDPIIAVDVGRRTLLMNWSHNLPGFLAAYPNYESEIGRLAWFLSLKSGFLRMIDVGANIGDTVAQLPEIKDAAFLCVEGSKKYCDLLATNFSSDRNVSCVHALVSDGEADASNRLLVEVGGTGHLGESLGPVAGSAPVATLDALVLRHTDFQRANLLKIDTDGFDFRVIKGASQLLKRARPALHFELSFGDWERVGGTNVADALGSLSAMGYPRGILYDNCGFLIGLDSFSEQTRLQVLHDYASRRKDFYLNVIAFHEESGWEAEFFASECQHRFH